MRLRTRLLILMWGTLLPMMIFGIMAATLIAQRERAVFEKGATERTRALLTAVDTELGGHVASLQLLASSRNLDFKNLRPFYDEVMRMLPVQRNWRNVNLALPSGQRIMDSSYPFGADLTVIRERSSFEQVLQTHRPAIGNLITETDNDDYQFAVRVPVLRESGSEYVLSVIVDPYAILALLTPQRLPTDWVAVVLDANHRVVARTVNHRGTFGGLASEDLRNALTRQTEGWFYGLTLEARPVYTPFSRSSFSGWTVAMGIPAEAVEAGASRAMWLLALGVVLAMGLAMILATALSRRISSPISSLAAVARALGRGTPIKPPDTGDVWEVHEVSCALVEAAEAVRERENALKAADRAKDEFLAMLGHELRNPLSALAAAAEVLQITESANNPPSRAAEVISRQVQHMTRLVDDLLDVSRVTTGKVSLSRRALNLAEVVTEVVRAWETSGRLKQHRIRIEATPIWVSADEARIEQITANLLGNAIKFTPPQGRIEIRVLRREDEAVLEVSDTGIGLSADLVPQVFDLFVQGEASLDRSLGGLGVGLTLVKRLAELHGGNATVTSEGPGRGACFSVTLPAIEEPDQTGSVTNLRTEEKRHGDKVLLIEDNPDARQTMLAALALYGYQTFAAADGYAGIKVIETVHPKVAIVDIGLPGMDGYQVAQHLRTMPDGASMLLIALSGYGQPESRRRALDAGFDEYLTKPVAPEILAKKIEAALAARN